MKTLFFVIVLAIAGWFVFKPPADATTASTVATATVVANAQTPSGTAAQSTPSRAPETVVRVAAETTTAQSENTGFLKGLFVGVTAAFGALFAGGWLLVGMGTIGWLAFALVLFIPMAAIGILSEYSDSRIGWFWRESKRGQRERIDTHEFATTLIFVGMLAFLNYGGLPIWETLMSWKAAPAIAIWVAIGIGWSVYRWKDFSAFLHELFTETKTQLALQLKESMDALVKLRTDFRKGTGLSKDDPLPTKAVSMGSFNSQDVQYGLKAISDEENRLRAAFTKAEGAEDAPFTDEDLKYWSQQLGRSTPEKTVLVPEFSDYIIGKATKRSPTTKNEHKGQLFLWVFFWPFSMGLRAIRKIITLRILHDVFNAFLKRFGYIYDNIEAKNRIEDEVVSRRGGTPTPTGPAEAPMLREVGKD